jgi:hypothetical protein
MKAKVNFSRQQKKAQHDAAPFKLTVSSIRDDQLAAAARWR